MYQTILVEVTDHVKTITLNRPGQFNALNQQLLLELTQEIMKTKSEKHCRALIMTGAGNHFAAGADLKGIADMDADAFQSYIHLFQELLWQLENLPILTVAAVKGYAYGGGCELSLACDFRFASPDAKFALPEIKLGLIPGAGGTYRLPKLIGLSRAKMMLYTGEPVSADEAFRMGLVDRVIDGESLASETAAFCKKIAQQPIWAFQALKQSSQHAVQVDVYSARQMEVQSILSVFKTKDRAEGVQAFIEKRSPNFIGE